MSADALSERCDVSPPTIYRRSDRPDEHGLRPKSTPDVSATEGVFCFERL